MVVGPLHAGPCGSTILMPHIISSTIPIVVSKEKIVVNVMWSMIVLFLSSRSSLRFVPHRTGFSVVESFPHSCEDFRVMTNEIPQDGERPTEGSPDQPPPKARYRETKATRIAVSALVRSSLVESLVR